MRSETIKPRSSLANATAIMHKMYAGISSRVLPNRVIAFLVTCAWGKGKSLQTFKKTKGSLSTMILRFRYWQEMERSRRPHCQLTLVSFLYIAEPLTVTSNVFPFYWSLPRRYLKAHSWYWRASHGNESKVSVIVLTDRWPTLHIIMISVGTIVFLDPGFHVGTAS